MSTDALTEHESDHARGQCGCPCLWMVEEERASEVGERCGFSFGTPDWVCGRAPDHPFHDHAVSKPHDPSEQCHTFVPTPRPTDPTEHTHPESIPPCPACERAARAAAERERAGFACEGGIPMTLDDLAALAREATPGPWYVGSRNEHGVVRSPKHGLVVSSPWTATGRADSDARYIAACSPEVIDALVEAARALSNLVYHASEMVLDHENATMLHTEWAELAEAVDAARIALATLEEVMSR